jgi:hypothetical protein
MKKILKDQLFWSSICILFLIIYLVAKAYQESPSPIAITCLGVILISLIIKIYLTLRTDMK